MRINNYKQRIFRNPLHGSLRRNEKVAFSALLGFFNKRFCKAGGFVDHNMGVLIHIAAGFRHGYGGADAVKVAETVTHGKHVSA